MQRLPTQRYPRPELLSSGNQEAPEAVQPTVWPLNPSYCVTCELGLAPRKAGVAAYGIHRTRLVLRIGKVLESCPKLDRKFCES